MNYLGGKFRLGKNISNSFPKFEGTFYEPFCGSCWVSFYLRPKKAVLSDVNEDLINLWKALQRGWIPPDFVSEELYQEAKKGNVESHLRAFIGFGCSFSGKFFGGYARDKSNRNYALNAKNSLLKKIDVLRNYEFLHCSYEKIMPDEQDLVYCDPPYMSTTKYKETPDFDYSSFWKWAMSLKCPVFVSEYNAPENWKIHKTFETKTDIHTKVGKEKRIEKIYALS